MSPSLPPPRGPGMGSPPDPKPTQHRPTNGGADPGAGNTPPEPTSAANGAGPPPDDASTALPEPSGAGNGQDDASGTAPPEPNGADDGPGPLPSFDELLARAKALGPGDVAGLDALARDAAEAGMDDAQTELLAGASKRSVGLAIGIVRKKFDAPRKALEAYEREARAPGSLVEFQPLTDEQREVAMAKAEHLAAEDLNDTPDKLRLMHFWAYLELHKYICLRAGGALWPASSVDAKLPWPIKLDEHGKPVLDLKGNPHRIAPSKWLDKRRSVTQLSWIPGEPEIIRDAAVKNEGLVVSLGMAIYNLYRPPEKLPGDAAQAGPWIELVQRLYPDDAEHIFDVLAHRVQAPHIKINHALVLGGGQGIGKDALLQPALHAVGTQNCRDESPVTIMGRFNPFLRSVILRINEGRDLGDVDRYRFYDHTKNMIASPPETLWVDDKNLRTHPIPNLCFVTLTTNYKTTGLYLPADDRRHYCAWSEVKRDDRDKPYWDGLWGWYDRGGYGHVAAFLRERDLSGFNPKAPPRRTAAWWAIVDTNRSPEEPELADAIERLGNPDAFTIGQLKGAALGSDLWGWLDDRRNRRTIPHRLEACGYVVVRNPDAKEDGYWRCPVHDAKGQAIPGRMARQAVYAKKSLSRPEQELAARKIRP